jgi:hypothetical protein
MGHVNTLLETRRQEMLSSNDSILPCLLYPLCTLGSSLTEHEKNHL